MTDEQPSTQQPNVKEAAREAVREELSVTDPDGKHVTFGGLLDAGLTRREALMVLGSVAGGVVLGAAIEETISNLSGREPPQSSRSPLQRAMDGYVVPIASGLGVEEAVDPAATGTPVQDVLDAVARAGGGTALLPPEPITEADTVVLHDQTALQGYWGSSEIAFPQGTDGILIDADRSSHSTGEYVVRTAIGGVTLKGPGYDTPNAGVAIRDRGLWLSRIGMVEFDNWNGVTWLVEEEAGSFDNQFDYVYFTQCDAGEASGRGDGLLTWNSFGSTNAFGYIAAYPTAAHSGQRSRVLATRGMAASIDVMNIGNAASTAITGFYNEIHVDTIHWEPTQVDQPIDHILELQGSNPFTLGALTLNANAKARHAYSVESGGHLHLPAPRVVDDAALTGEPLRLATRPVGPITYFGASDGVVTRSNWNTGNCSCLADLTVVA